METSSCVPILFIGCHFLSRAPPLPALKKRNVRNDVLRGERPSKSRPQAGERPVEEEVDKLCRVHVRHVLLLFCRDHAVRIGFRFCAFLGFVMIWLGVFAHFVIIAAFAYLLWLGVDHRSWLNRFVARVIRRL